VNDIEKILLLCAAGPVVRMMREGGASWQFIAYKMRKTANPLGLSPRQLQRIYEGPQRYRFDVLKRVINRHW